MTRLAYQSRAEVLAIDEFDAAWKDGWRQVQRSLSGLGKRERQVIDDLKRGRGTTMLREGFEIIRQASTCANDATALCESLRGFVMAGHTLDVTEPEAMLRETEANEHGNMAQIKRALYGDRGSRDQVIETMNGQAIASRLLADTLWRERPALIKAGR
jgi:hypothetical protein